MKKILVICGAGIATSTLVKSKIQKFLQEHHLPAEIKTSTIASANAHINWADFVITTTKFVPERDIPVLRVLSILTGGDTGAFYEELLALMQM